MLNLNTFMHLLENTKKDKFKIENTIYNIHKILFILNELYNNNDKDDIFYIILFESASIYMKKIIDIEQLVNKDNKKDLLLLEFNKIRNITAHEKIKYRVKGKCIYFSDNLSRSKFYYNKYYSKNDGTIDMIAFIVYYLYIIVNKLIKKYNLDINNNNIAVYNEYSYISESIKIFNSLTSSLDINEISNDVKPNQITILWKEIYELKVLIKNNANYKYIKKQIYDIKNKISKINEGDEKDLLLNQLEDIEKDFYRK